jgi:hypothetical protein
MNDTKQPVTITGPTLCVVGACAGHDADECRANALSNGGIMCVVCGDTYPSEIVKLITALRGDGFRLRIAQSGSRYKNDRGSEGYAAACLSGYDPALYQYTRFEFERDGGFVNGLISYTAEEALYAASEPTDNFGHVFVGNELAKIQPAALDMIQKATALGFRCTLASDQDGECIVKLAKGRGIVGTKFEDGRPVPDPEKVCILGISIEVRWGY